MKQENNQNLYYLRGINSFEDYTHIRKMIGLIEHVAREVVYNGAAYIRIPADIGLFRISNILHNSNIWRRA